MVSGEMIIFFTVFCGANGVLVVIFGWYIRLFFHTLSLRLRFLHAPKSDARCYPHPEKKEKKNPLQPVIHPPPPSPCNPTNSGTTPTNPLSQRTHPSTTHLWRLRRRRRQIQPRILRHHPLQPNAHTFNNSEQNRATDGAVACGAETTANGEGAAGHEACYYCRFWCAGGRWLVVIFIS